MQKALGIILGVATHGLFIYTVWHLYRFLLADTHVAAVGPLWSDAWLAGQFAVVHSVLLHPFVRQRLTRWVPPAFYGLLFCIATCVTLLAMIQGWKSADSTIWRLTGWARVGIVAAFYGSWVALFYSLYLSGLGYQTGLTPWWHWVRGRRLPDRKFRPRSLYRVLRHPVYLSFLGFVWFNPVMTLDRLLLAFVWSGYIFIGSYLKDERLAYFLGEPYREYQGQVPGFPLMPFGPLARRNRQESGEIGRGFQPASTAMRKAA